MKVMGKTERAFLPYGRQRITDDDIDAVVEVLRSDWLTQGPSIPRFEEALAAVVGAQQTVACATGTAALHLTMLAAGIGPGDQIVTTPNTFLADANCARFVGADVTFADIDPATGNIDPDSLATVLDADQDRKIKAVIPVHFAGQPVDLPRIHQLATSHGAIVIDDACHALGGSYEHDGKKHQLGSGRHSTMTVYSFHPVKHVAMGEGGAVATNDPELADRLRLFRNHGIVKSNFVNESMGLSSNGDVNPWYHEMQQLGYNFRLTDIQATLGLSQLKRIDWSVKKRNEIASRYLRLIGQHFPNGQVRPLDLRPGVIHAYHLFVVRIDYDSYGITRAAVMTKLRDAGIGTQVHYIPVPLQPYYRAYGGFKPGDYLGAEAYYEQALSLPMYPDLTETDITRVIDALVTILGGDR